MSSPPNRRPETSHHLYRKDPGPHSSRDTNRRKNRLSRGYMRFRRLLRRFVPKEVLRVLFTTAIVAGGLDTDCSLALTVRFLISAGRAEVALRPTVETSGTRCWELCWVVIVTGVSTRSLRFAARPAVGGCGVSCLVLAVRLPTLLSVGRAEGALRPIVETCGTRCWGLCWVVMVAGVSTRLLRFAARPAVGGWGCVGTVGGVSTRFLRWY